MIWLTWRQFRTPAAMTLATLAVLAIVLVITGIPLNHLYYTSGIKTCSSVGDCGQVIGAFFEHDQILQHLRPIVILVPAVVGIFWGAPLVAREIETGTHRMVWTQSITRTRWLATKLGVLGIASIVVTEALNLMETWWFRPIDKINQDRFTGSFSQAGLVPIGYAAFAFALGVTAGLLIRRTLPAMAATLVGFTAARVAMTYWIRPHLLAPAHLNLALDPASTGFGRANGGPINLWPEAPRIPNSWIYSNHIVDNAGHALTSQQLASLCPTLETIGRPAGQSGGAPIRDPVPDDIQARLQECIAKVGTTYHQAVTYQPANRYWTFQWYETSVFLTAALALAGLCFWLIRRRLT
jgi:hypothetical protein